MTLKYIVLILLCILHATAYMLQRIYAMAIPSVHLSVITRVLCIKMAERIIDFF